MLKLLLAEITMPEVLLMSLKGILGTFLVIALILVVIYVLNRVTRKKVQ